jgi:hypothetical protein
MLVRWLAVLSLTLLVAGCATAPVNSLAQDKRDSLRIDAVEVSFAADAKVEWYDAQGAAPEEPKARLAYLEQKAIGPIKAALDAEIPATFRGDSPARLKVRLRLVRIPATAARIIIGAMPYAIRSDMELVDSRTGRTLLSATDFNGIAQSQGGIVGVAVEAAIADEPIVRLSKVYAHVLSTWLKTGRKLAIG